jgi:beta-aspartyl-peptidase (threonine type)
MAGRNPVEMLLPAVIVHGGATSFEKKHHSDIMVAVKDAAAMGMRALKNGGSSLDAVEAAIWVLEETNLFTAGLGASQNLDGEVEVDAMIMDGNRLQSGSVMGVRDLAHPISLARYVLERTPVMQVVGSGAEKLYKKMTSEGYRREVALRRTDAPAIVKDADTVGAVAVDTNGRISAGSSTSGWPGKLPGRVGDSPIIGSGVYANDVAGASCTGKGEQILRIVMGRIAVLHVESGKTVKEAAELAVSELRQKTSGQAGLILADSRGNVSLAYDTPHMPVAIAHAGSSALYSSMTPESP